jgi:predicted DCC family thiol-disulfide oxidoreductase YuxK
MVNDSTPSQATLTVLYDAACPLCRREIAMYRGLQADTQLCFADISDSEVPLPEGVTREQLMARFHVRRLDGSLESGARAFLALWSVLPGWRWLAMVGRLPGAAWAMELAYRAFLHLRPSLQDWAAKLDRPRGSSEADARCQQACVNVPADRKNVTSPSEKAR